MTWTTPGPSGRACGQDLGGVVVCWFLLQTVHGHLADKSLSAIGAAYLSE